MDIIFRRLTAADKPRVLEISAGVWDGEDYVPAIIDAWLTAADAELIAAVVGDEVVGFARSAWVAPGYIWQHGLRIHADWRNRGIARAITQRQIEFATEAGAQRIGLSVYLDNAASQRLVSTHGFERVAGFVYVTADAVSAARAQARFSPAVAEVSPDEAVPFIRDSVFLTAAWGFLPEGWLFRPFVLDPSRALAGNKRLLGVRHAGRLVALLCTSVGESGPSAVALDYLDGPPEAMSELACHLLASAGDATIEGMMPKGEAGEAPALVVLRQLGFTAWNGFEADVFVYERELRTPMT